MTSISITAKGIEQVQRKLDRFQSAMANPTPANREASIAMYGWLIRNYDKEGADIGGWAPLKPRTIAEKKKLGKEKMLVRTGQLRASFTSFFSKENAGVGSKIIYAKPHQEGDPSKNLPARPMLPPRHVVEDIGVKVYGLYVARQAAKVNG